MYISYAILLKNNGSVVNEPPLQDKKYWCKDGEWTDYKYIRKNTIGWKCTKLKRIRI
jgi:hypothetical protein